MKILALDYGTKRVGIAISDETRILARPLPFFKATPFAQFLTDLKALIAEQEVGLILVGIPRNMDGSYGASAQNAEEFYLRLKEALTVPVRKIDERLSTVQASRQLRESGLKAHQQKTLIDSQSATVLLQSFLDTMPQL